MALGSMRLPSDRRDERLALETIAAAAEEGVTVFDTARAYGRAGPSSVTTSGCCPALRACGADATRASSRRAA